VPRDVEVADVARFYTVLQQGMALQAQHGATRAELAGIAALAMAKWPS
jgi:hypothetical protein